MSLLNQKCIRSKILTFEELQLVLETDRKAGLKIVQCHGVFDLLHPGHIRHFKEAKSLGDKLIVTVTPDRFVNKGPGRPAFNQDLRLEAISALDIVDFVILNDSPDAVSAIQKVHPHFYVKGMEYHQALDDITGKISEEKIAVEQIGGIIHYTNDIVFSSSTLINRYIDPISPEVLDFLKKIKQEHTLNDLLKKIEDLSDLKVLIIGDAIIDEYQYVSPLGQSGKGLHMVARCHEKEIFLGGSLIIANHIAQYAGEVTLITSVGKNCPYSDFIKQHLDKKVKTQFLEF